ncbi:MAG TPA: NADPH-dependent 7-cyano-7-deazaguanine reductase QueF [Desulfomonilia bacterium]|nr:NADPH-dependent 7-cyano-7-deazaguanine reductase QueF [Desulfomonilia bacterium]
MKGMPLGRNVKPPQKRDPGVLYPIERKPCPVTVHGYDLWRAYEFSWLNGRGKPAAGILEIAYPVRSACIVESKSLKLYLVGLSYERFASEESLEPVIREDLVSILKPEWLSVRIIGASNFSEMAPQNFMRGTCLDTLDIGVEKSPRNPALLSCKPGLGEETLTSDLLRTFCPITGQPDWATVVIRYRGRALDHASLLRYVCSYRGHSGFAEEVCELIYVDLVERCSPERLCVTCFYTRRGGIDISAHRCSDPVGLDGVERMRLIRQ